LDDKWRRKPPDWFLAVPGLTDDAEKIRHNGMHHCAFEYDSFADLMSSFDRMRKASVEPAFCLDHGLTISLYYKDPEGNFVELQSDNFADWKLSGEWMRTSPDFAANPIGTFFDPARVYDEFQSGVDFKALETAIRGGVSPTLCPTSACRYSRVGRSERRRRSPVHLLLSSGRTGMIREEVKKSSMKIKKAWTLRIAVVFHPAATQADEASRVAHLQAADFVSLYN
jgi:hypothetical protein